MYPDKIAGVKRGVTMSHDEANHEKPNPNFGKKTGILFEKYGYDTNCQTCVVAYELRLRGYPVQAKPNRRNSKIRELSYYTNKAWIDPNTGYYPKYITFERAEDSASFFNSLEEVISKDSPNSRYTIEFAWRGRSRSGHIISLNRDESGQLRLYDPQSSEIYSGERFKFYFNRIVLSSTKVLRVDDKLPNLKMANHILKKEE